MMRFYDLLPGAEPDPQIGEYNGAHRWMLPGVNCPACKAIWAGAGVHYPAVDLSVLPEAKKYEKARLEQDFTEYERLRDQVRGFVSPDDPLEPGATFGPLVGTAKGPYSAFVHQYGDVLLVREDVLEPLFSKGLRGLRTVRTALRFRPKGVEELLEFDIPHRGLLHPDCIPPRFATPCPKCGRRGQGLPKEPILDAASLPPDLDLMRLRNYAMVLVVTQRFKDAVEQLELDGLSFRELPVR